MRAETGRYTPMCVEAPTETFKGTGHTPLSDSAYPPDQAPATDKANASKKDVGKAPLWQGCLRYFPRALLAVAYVSEYGDRKYTPPGGEHYSDGWANVPNGVNRYMDADARHFLKIATEGDYDDSDSGLAHLAQKAWNSLAELERAIRDKKIDIRIGNDIVDGKPVLGTARGIEL